MIVMIRRQPFMREILAKWRLTMHVRILRHPSKDNKSSGYWKSRLLAKRHFTSMRDSTRFLCVCAVAAAFGAIALSSSAQNVRYWVWQRDEPLDDREHAELAAQ